MVERPVELSIVIVSWNVKDLLRACLESLRAQWPFGEPDAAGRAEVFVVDNASGDSTSTMLALEFPWAKLIANPQNVGFTKANNQAIIQSSGRYVLLLNPDTEVLPGGLERMAGFMDLHPDVGMLGPQLLFPDGTVQSSRRRFPTMVTALIESTVLQRWLPNHPSLNAYYVADRSNDEVQEVDWVVGACLLVRREVIEQVGILDQRFFMYSEELDWCYRAKRASWKVMYLPEAKVVHHEARSSDQNVLTRNIHFHNSKCEFFAKHHGPWQGLALRVFILLTFVFLIAEDTAKLLLISRNRSMRRQRIAVLAAAARWHLFRILGREGA
ncbi:MAG: glycosyltransferase family 2 protein [Chloroflexi bacterium]|nr:glycosyltransferase family 2 protein [Chloroflexota bacterium]